MKTSIRTIILAATSVFAAMSCQKEAAVSETRDQVKTGETIQVNVNASLGDLVAADGTKAEAKSVVRLEWTDGDKVQAYCGTTKISTGDGLTVTPSGNKMFASLTGTITAPEAGKTITFVYSNVNSEQGNELTFDFSNQTTTAIPFVAYATLVCDGTETLTGKMVEFTFATSVMKIAVTNLGGGSITDATISKINTKVILTPSEISTPEIRGNDVLGDISTTNIAAPSDGTKAIITVGLVPDAYSGRNITVKQTGYINKGVITSSEIKSNTSYTTPAALFPCGKISDGNGTERDYVLIAGTKWATRNVGATAVTGTNSYGTYFAWGDVTGQTAETKEGDSEIQNAFSYGFSQSTYSYTDKPKKLPLENDAANICWGDPWRMPTSAEFQALYDATCWKWDSGDKGFYVHAPHSGDAGTVISDAGYTGAYDKSHALLFFPAAGYGYETSLWYAGSMGRYWSSSLNDNTAFYLEFVLEKVGPQESVSRYSGLSVRPVSD